jgi:two-component system response regulator VicR
MKKIAVVNDEQDFVEMVKLLLEDEGYGIQSTGDGDSALQLIESWHPDLVILDIKMRGLSGWQILDRMYQDPSLKEVRVLVTSGAVEEIGDARARLREHGNDFLALPFDIDDFIRKVKEMVD